MARYLRAKPERKLSRRAPKEIRSASARLADYQGLMQFVFRGRPLVLVRPDYKERTL